MVLVNYWFSYQEHWLLNDKRWLAWILHCMIPFWRKNVPSTTQGCEVNSWSGHNRVHRVHWKDSQILWASRERMMIVNSKKILASKTQRAWLSILNLNFSTYGCKDIKKTEDHHQRRKRQERERKNSEWWIVPEIHDSHWSVDHDWLTSFNQSKVMIHSKRTDWIRVQSLPQEIIFYINTMSPKTPPEITELRKRIKKLSGKHENFLKTLHEETWISFSHISLFKDWKRGIWMENYFLLESTVKKLEEMFASVE